MRTAWAASSLVCAALVLGGCSKKADTSAGAPATGGTPEVARPVAPDTPPGGSSGMAGSQAPSGASGADAPAGTTGAGTMGATPGPGTGLTGGLGTGSSIAGSSPAAGSVTAVPQGSPNTTSKDAVGQRP